MKDVPEPKIRDDEVLIRVRRAGVCGTDVHIYEWDAWAQGRVKPPIVVGHDPDFSDLVAELTASPSVSMKKGAFLRIDVDRPLRAGSGRLAWLVPRVEPVEPGGGP